MTKIRLSRIFWVGAAAILVVAALVALTAVVRGDFSDNDGRILVTLAALLYTGGTASPVSHWPSAARLRNWGGRSRRPRPSAWRWSPGGSGRSCSTAEATTTRRAPPGAQS